MISDLFRSPCWSRKCLVRLPQFREHDYRGLITSPDPVLNRQKITRLCYDFLSQIWGVDFKRSTPARHVFLLCVDVCFRSTIWFANGKQKFRRSTRFLFAVELIFRTKLSRTTMTKWQQTFEPRNSIYIYAKEGQDSSTQPFHLLTIFPIKPCVIFWTGSPSSVPYTAKLEPGIFVNRMDFGTGQSTLKFHLLISVYRKIWTVVRS